RAGRVRLALALLGVVLVAVFVMRIGPAEVRAQLSRVGPSVLWLCVPYALGTALGAFPWAWLLPADARPSTPGLVVGRFAASGANALLPAFGMAGEPSRLLWLRRDRHAQGLAAILVDRALYNLASNLLLLTGGVAALAVGLPLYVGAAATAAAL